MTMNQYPEHLPRPAEQLDEIAGYYDSHDTSAEMEHGHWVEPHPMATTSLRLPVEVITELKREASKRGIRYTTYLRAILEHAAHPDANTELTDIRNSLARIEHALTDHHDDPRTSA